MMPSNVKPSGSTRVQRAIRAARTTRARHLALSCALTLAVAACASRGEEGSVQPAAAQPAAVQPAAAPEPLAPAVTKGPFCSPMAYAGVVVNISEGRDVAAIHGEGLSVPAQSGDAAVAHVDPSGTLVMVTETGTDSVVMRLSVQTAASVPEAWRAGLAAHVSERMRNERAFGPSGVLHLGQPAAEVERLLGAPGERRPAGSGEEWEYHTDYGHTECVGTEDIVLVFSEGELQQIVFAGTG